ncbi:unnamed protein product [Linum trigynum]|uniref:Uncharacterized protein n=1 Tax=Linum trigynum TaxID=586398 RepID=A0AAV2FBA3_9ROSI
MTWKRADILLWSFRGASMLLGTPSMSTGSARSSRLRRVNGSSSSFRLVESGARKPFDPLYGLFLLNQMSILENICVRPVVGTNLSAVHESDLKVLCQSIDIMVSN